MLPLFVYAVIFIHMCLFWLWYKRLQNPSVVDVGWASALTLSGVIYLLSNPITAKTVVFCILLIIWGERLGFYLWFTRIHRGIVDKRYTQLSNSWSDKPMGFFLNFQLQGLLIFIVATPWYFTGLASTNPFSFLDMLGVLLVIGGLIGETIADHQLSQYKKNPTGSICQIGLWQYSRHPNYFFEWLVWCGFALFGLAHSAGYIGFISPIALYLIMNFITGPMTEAGSIQARGQAYLDYQKSTPMFFPNIKAWYLALKK